MSDEVYSRLREFLDKLPAGFPATDSGVEIKILKKLFTPEQAEIVMHLQRTPELVSAIASRLSMMESEAAARLEAMAKHGLIFRVREAGTTRYSAMHFMLGIYEWQVKAIDREFAELVDPFLPYIGFRMLQAKTKQLRVVPVNSAIEARPEVSSYHKIHDLVKGKKLIAVRECICAREQALLGKTCDRPSEVCVVFDAYAEYNIENEIARPISEDELMCLLAEAEESGLVASPGNAKDLAFLCLCCSSCCGILRNIKRLPRPVDLVQSSFQAAIDAHSCSACGLCLERCQMAAIVENEGGFSIDLGRCIGCGLCVARCPEKAISLVEKPDLPSLPADIFETHNCIAKELGVG